MIITGRKAARGKPLTTAQKEANRLVSRERAADKHGFGVRLVGVRRPCGHPTAMRAAPDVQTDETEVGDRSQARLAQLRAAESLSGDLRSEVTGQTPACEDPCYFAIRTSSARPPSR